jgi:hypothetical protein
MRILSIQVRAREDLEEYWLLGGCGGRDEGNDEENGSRRSVALEERFGGLEEEERDGAQGWKGEGPVLKRILLCCQSRG